MGLLDGGIRTTIGGILPGFLVAATFHKITRVADGQGGFTENETDYTVKALKQTASFKQMRDGRPAGSAVFLFAQTPYTFTPERGDRITYSGEKYRVDAVSSDPAAATWELEAAPFQVQV